MSSWRSTDEGKHYPVITPQGGQYKEPEMKVSSKIDQTMYMAHDASADHVEEFSKEGFHGMKGHLAAKHSTDFDKANEELYDLDLDQLDALHRSLHRGTGTIPALTEKEKFKDLQKKLQLAPMGGTVDERGVQVDVLSPEERELFERVRPKMPEREGEEEPESGKLVRGAPDLGPVIARQYYTPAEPPFYYQGKKMNINIRAEVFAKEMARERKIQAIMETGKTREEAMEILARSPGPEGY